MSSPSLFRYLKQSASVFSELSQPHAIRLVRCDSFRKRATYEPKDTDRRMLESWRLRTVRQRDVDFMRNLRGDFMIG